MTPTRRDERNATADVVRVAGERPTVPYDDAVGRWESEGGHIAGHLAGHGRIDGP